MKFWKAFGLGALAISVLPYRLTYNSEDGTGLYESLLFRAKKSPFVDEEGTDGLGVEIKLFPGLRRDKEEDDPFLDAEEAEEPAADSVIHTDADPNPAD